MQDGGTPARDPPASPGAALSQCTDKLLPAELADLLQALLDDRLPITPLVLTT